jgi:hypothetical protein
MRIWTLYHRPINHTEEWVVRLFELDKPTDTIFASDSKEECEEFVHAQHPGAYWLPRMDGDDPVVHGAWI